MSKFSELANKLFNENLLIPYSSFCIPQSRNPIHVVYGGADRFTAETPIKLGKLALKSMDEYAPNFVRFANVMWLKGCDSLPIYDDLIADLEFQLIDNTEKVKSENFPAWFAWTIYNRVFEKLKREPIEDFRIDFEDGFGIRGDEEEDKFALQASEELAKLIKRHSYDETKREIDIFKPLLSSSISAPLFSCGLRIKCFQPETYARSTRTLELFLSNLLQKTNSVLPENFVVTLPKITNAKEVAVLDQLLNEIEKHHNLPKHTIKIEIMIETPEAIFIMQELVNTAKNRIISAHFGAYDYTASLGITAVYQHLKHDACNFARNIMQVSLSPLGIRLSDSVTTEMPVPIYKAENLNAKQVKENISAVHNAWRLHFNNVQHSLINGFYQSWDLHPAQLVARYAAVYSFFLESFDEQSKRLKSFLDKATKATMSGNQFDDAASAQGLLNYFIRAVSSGALSEYEVLRATNLTAEELNSGSFIRIMENRLG
jgi:hypothetical protein